MIGQQNDGSMGIRVSSTGIDAFVGDGQGGDFTFNSDWTDIAKIHQLGKIDWSSTGAAGYPGFQAVWSDQGFLPFIEVRKGSGSTINDDYYSAGPSPPYYQTGNPNFALTNTLLRLSETSSGSFLVYMVYKVAVPKVTGL